MLKNTLSPLQPVHDLDCSLDSKTLKWRVQRGKTGSIKQSCTRKNVMMQKPLNKPAQPGPIAAAETKTVCASVKESVARAWDAATASKFGHGS